MDWEVAMTGGLWPTECACFGRQVAYGPEIGAQGTRLAGASGCAITVKRKEMAGKQPCPGAGEGNRTLASSLGSSHSTTELHPL